jgi:hypothetical protein
LKRQSAGTPNHFLQTARRQGPAVASAVTIAAVAIFFFHAPVEPVLGGCGLALAILFARTWSRLRASDRFRA